MLSISGLYGLFSAYFTSVFTYKKYKSLDIIHEYEPTKSVGQMFDSWQQHSCTEEITQRYSDKLLIRSLICVLWIFVACLPSTKHNFCLFIQAIHTYIVEQFDAFLSIRFCMNVMYHHELLMFLMKY